MNSSATRAAAPARTARPASPPRVVLQRKCGCGTHTPGGGTCSECSRKSDREPAAGGAALAQAKLTVGASSDPLELEADRVAERVTGAQPGLTCAAEPPRFQRYSSGAGEAAMEAPESVGHALAGGGRGLDGALRDEMESRFGRDFSHVRVYSGSAAERSAADVGARAYTVGSDIVFGSGEFSPGTQAGRRLLAHELAHVVQQGAAGAAGSGAAQRTVRRCANPAKNNPRYDTLAEKLKRRPAYVALPTVATQPEPGTKAIADQIMVDLKSKSACLWWLYRLQVLFDTPVNPPDTVKAETKAATAVAVKAEKARVAKPAGKSQTVLEERRVASGKAGAVRVAGRSGGGHFFINKSDARNITVFLKVLLEAKAGATDDDVNAVIEMEDAIEKHASTQGYVVDIEFVRVADGDAFKIGVDPKRWIDAGNWSGGDAKGIAHELHHVLALDVDRYDYIEAHSTNPSMTPSNRLIWFADELKKPAGWNDPTSMMDDAEHPNDVDVCEVAGMALPDCSTKRKALRKAHAELMAYRGWDQRIMKCIAKHSGDAPLMMAVLREFFGAILADAELSKSLTKRLNDKSDALGAAFDKLTAAQKKELLDLIKP